MTAHTTPTLQARMLGDGPPLVLMGGGLTGWKSWEPHAERLADHRTVARLQLLNVQLGLEDRPLPDGYSARSESAALARALDELAWHEPVDLVGWSYGALVMLDFALDRPDRVRTLTMIEPPATWALPDAGAGDAGVQALLALARAIGHDVSEADLERFIRAVGMCPPGMSPDELPEWPLWLEHRRSLRAMDAAPGHTDDIARLHELDVPVLLVTGTGTAPFLRRIHDTLASHLPRARTTEMPAGHAPHIVSMDRFLGELERFHADGAGAALKPETQRVTR
jgi:pimeloyl-ACP methyl ester carboxylesterase